MALVKHSNDQSHCPNTAGASSHFRESPNFSEKTFLLPLRTGQNFYTSGVFGTLARFLLTHNGSHRHPGIGILPPRFREIAQKCPKILQISPKSTESEIYLVIFRVVSPGTHEKGGTPHTTRFRYQIKRVIVPQLQILILLVYRPCRIRIICRML